MPWICIKWKIEKYFWHAKVSVAYLIACSMRNMSCLWKELDDVTLFLYIFSCLSTFVHTFDLVYIVNASITMFVVVIDTHAGAWIRHRPSKKPSYQFVVQEKY